jgi:hypothetical protein
MRLVELTSRKRESPRFDPKRWEASRRLWAPTTSDCSSAFTRIRDSVAVLLVDSAVLDGEAIVVRPSDAGMAENELAKDEEPGFRQAVTSPDL